MSSGLIPIRRALVSVSDKTDLVPLVRALRDFGVQIISTGGTANLLQEAGVEVVKVSEVTGFPEMMDGRVKTLHPAIHGALLGRRDEAQHVQAMDEHGIEPIDLVCVSLYPFEQTVMANGVTTAEAIEQIDIGGPAMLRSSAKNHDYVTVLTSPGQYDFFINELRRCDGSTSVQLRRDLAAAAFARTAEYDTAISVWMSSSRSAADDRFPEMFRTNYAKIRELRYGENPHQRAALYAELAPGRPSVVTSRVIQGKPLSYNNLNDSAAALELVKDLHDTFDAPSAAVIKHANPCGAAVGQDTSEAVDRALRGDPLAAYGGVLAVSRPIDLQVAELLADPEAGRFLEMIIAPEFTQDAAVCLGNRWAKARLLAIGPMDGRRGSGLHARTIPGGLLVQENDVRLANQSDWNHAAGPAPDETMTKTAQFVWTVVKHLKSNAIAIASESRLLGGGPGQVDRVGACQIAIDKAAAAMKEIQSPAVAASDAFFPFPDGPQKLIDAGVRCLVQPGGSIRDQETFDLCDAKGVTCLLTGVRHFRH